ncbi:MAG: DUF4301 family protein, partial [Spirochaetaceae bacterium]|nr:DUF4301 family protein [Spirochaetaceae bacterium]
MFTSNDLNELEKRGISKEIAEQQIDLIKQGNQPDEAIRAAHVNDGIQRLSPHQKKIYIELWKEEKKNWNYEKFVPASGAASRM